MSSTNKLIFRIAALALFILFLIAKKSIIQLFDTYTAAGIGSMILFASLFVWLVIIRQKNK